ncbi:hypothetical protein WJX75_007053 [Coccomyxa subellipsoidea]|uniref:DEK-C domain-containing protein n=1 Tax=Coccomyxa subellipsoidea TaxID=248742 RepID=A0ABR2YS41_9CHLO
MAGPAEADIRREVKIILEEADLSTVSERNIRELLSSKFGDAVETDAYKKLITAEIEDFLANLAPLEDTHEETEELVLSSQAPLGQARGKRKAEAVAEPSHQAKIARSTNSAQEATFDLSDRRQVTVRSFKGTPLVDIREFYDKDGQLLPGKKGIALTTEQWATVKASAAAVLKALEAETEDFTVELTAQRKLRVRLVGKNLCVDIREFYEKDGEDAPGKKGISLQADQWESLVGATADIDAELQAFGAPSTTKPKESAGKGKAAATPSPAGPSEAAQTIKQSSDTLPVILSSNRRADISNFKGSTFVNIREYYEKNGEMLPGSKGIALSAEQFRILKNAASDVTAALSSQDTDFKVSLSSKRAVRINQFKSSTMVDIREMYEKDGKELPGKKGISLVADQWHSLVKGFPALEGALP